MNICKPFWSFVAKSDIFVRYLLLLAVKSAINRTATDIIIKKTGLLSRLFSECLIFVVDYLNPAYMNCGKRFLQKLS